MVSGQYQGSAEAGDALNIKCGQAAPGSTRDGAVSLTPLNCGTTPTPPPFFPPDFPSPTPTPTPTPAPTPTPTPTPPFFPFFPTFTGQMAFL
jgi:hypothetical protein